MTEYGTVVDVKDEFATVRIERNSACGSCGKCGMTDKQKHVDFFALNGAEAKAGDRVEISLPEASSAKLAFVGYIVPLVPALALLFISLALGWKEWLALLFFVAGLAVGFGIVALVDNLKMHKWTKQAKIVRVVGSAEEIDLKQEN